MMAIHISTVHTCTMSLADMQMYVTFGFTMKHTDQHTTHKWQIAKVLILHRALVTNCK